VVLVVFIIVPSGNQDVTKEELQGEVNEWIDQLAESNDWNGNLVDAPVEDYPPDAAVRAIPRGWRVAQTRYDSLATVYNISRGGESAYLFCIRPKGKVSGLPKVPPMGPQWTTGGVAIGAWQRPGMVYVLVVDGNKRDYRSFFGPRTII